MIKPFRNGLLISMLAFSATGFAADRSVEININGIGPAVDGAAFNTVKQVIGFAVANGTVDKFLVRGYGFEGGFSACAQAAPNTRNFGAFVKQLKSIKPNRNTTAYSVQTVEAACAEEPVMCTQEAKLCPDGVTWVGRTGPACEFAPCPTTPAK